MTQDANGTLTRDQIIPMLLAACPQFQATWQAHLDDWSGYEPDERDRDAVEDGNIRGYFNDINAFQRYLIEQLRLGNEDEFPAAFAAIEQLMLRGDAAVREVLVIGLFEDLYQGNQSDVRFLRWAGIATHCGWYWVMGYHYKRAGFEKTLTGEIALWRKESSDH
jgi:hypothetical protein